MKFLVVLMFVAIVGLVLFKTGALNGLIYYSYCDDPIHYKIDDVDERFKVSEETFQVYSQEAIKTWNDAYGKPLFVYDPAGKLSVNLVFDERQGAYNEISNIQDGLEGTKTDLFPEIEQFEKDSDAFRRRADAFDAEVKKWNDQGGAPPDVYERLKSEQSALQSEANNLNARARALNRSTSDYNKQVNQLDEKIDSFNDSLGEKPEEGVYLPQENRIEVYFNINKDELVHTLTHEFGHALGLDHVEDKKAIMYPKTNESLQLSEADTAALTEFCKQRSVFDNLPALTKLVSFSN